MGAHISDTTMCVIFVAALFRALLFYALHIWGRGWYGMGGKMERELGSKGQEWAKGWMDGCMHGNRSQRIQYQMAFLFGQRAIR